MPSVSTLISEVEGRVGRGTGEDRGRTLSRLTDLFVHGSPSFAPEHVALFDAVIQRFATAIETGARIELATRLADLANAPPGVISRLAEDEIAVARPILVGSPRLNDQALMRIALSRGRDHMLAIGERRELSTLVTDVLVERGDGAVRHVVAGNPGARFSPVGAATLVAHARRDEWLCGLLGGRSDLSRADAHAIVEIAKASARRRLVATLPGSEKAVDAAIERSAGALASPGRPAARTYVARPVLAGREIDEEDLASLAEEGEVAEAISALARLSELPVGCIERIFEERDNDLLLVIGKAQGWSWVTVRMLLRLRDPTLSERHHFRRAHEAFDALASATAVRVLHVLRVREAAAETAGGPHAERVKPG